jgi:hypothetical protein
VQTLLSTSSEFPTWKVSSIGHFPKRPPPIPVGVMVPSHDHPLPLGHYSTTTDYGLSFLCSVHPDSDSPLLAAS